MNAKQISMIKNEEHTFTEIENFDVKIKNSTDLKNHLIFVDAKFI